MEHILLAPDELRTLIRESLRDELKHFSPTPLSPQDDELLTTAEAVKLLRVSKVTLHKFRKDGRIKFYRINTRIRFRKSELMEALQTTKKYGNTSR